METKIDDIRNIGIMAHIDAGKTTTTERILFYTGESHKIGNVDDGNTTTDWMEQEKERGITIQSAAVTCNWKNKQINIIDTPGHVDFTAEVERSLRVLDGAVAIFCAVGGVQPQTETVWKQSLKYSVPKIAFINKMDRMGANFDRVCDEIKKKFSITPLKMTIPVGSESSLEGVIDVLKEKFLIFDKDSQGANVEEHEIPSEYKEVVKTERDKIIQEAAGTSDELMEKYFSNSTLEIDEIKFGLKAGVKNGSLLPVYGGSSLKNIGVQPLLDAIVDFLPSPNERPAPTAIEAKNKKEFQLAYNNKAFAALVFKVQYDKQLGFLSYVRVYSGELKKGVMVYNCTREVKERAFRIVRIQADSYQELSEIKSGDIAAIIGFKSAFTGDTLCEEREKILLEKPSFPTPCISVAIECESSQDRQKLKSTLEILSHEDPTFIFKESAETGQILISGMGELHLDVLTTRIKDEFSISCNIGNPQVSYKECISKEGSMREKFEKSVGDKSFFAEIELALSSIKEDGEYSRNEITFDHSVEKNLPLDCLNICRLQLEDSMQGGIEQGYECIGVKVEVKALNLSSSFESDQKNLEVAIRAASAMCFDKLARTLAPILLEPVMTVSISTPAEFQGDCISSLIQRGGLVEGTESKGEDSIVITATCPLKNLFGFATALRSASSGKASFSQEFRAYKSQF